MSKLVSEGNPFYRPICNDCRHFREGVTCAAFPERIPKAILTGEHDHHEPYPGDGGVRFEAASK